MLLAYGGGHFSSSLLFKKERLMLSNIKTLDRLTSFLNYNQMKKVPAVAP